MAGSLEQLNRQIVEHNSHRRHFEREPEELAHQILEEAQELIDELKKSGATDEVFNVVGEIGDLYILLAQLCSDLNINPVDAFEYKALRNERKYGDWTMSNGYSQDEARRLSKEAWEAYGGDEAFSYIYLQLLANK